jgi:two-component system chemotaxis response regulator CheB
VARIPKIISIAIGTSSGGVLALYDILPKFPKTDSYALFIALHIPSGVVDSIVRRLDIRCPLKVKRARHGMSTEPGTAYIVPGDYHAEIMARGGVGIINLNKGPKVNFVRPSIDVLMESISDVFKENSIGVLLTGIGSDGARGMKAVKDAGGATIAQDKETSAVFSMPKSAIDKGCVDRVLPLKDIPGGTLRVIEEKTLKQGMRK